jgi:hypothetical protein
LLGYNNNNEEWNNIYANDPTTSHLLSAPLPSQFINDIQYHTHDGCDNPTRFKSTQLKQIINFIESYNKPTLGKYLKMIGSSTLGQ